jgi:hypothetical protein
MLQADEFKEVVKAVEGGTATPEQVKAMLTTIYELDTNLVILQNALELAVANSVELFPAITEKILSMAGRTDGKSKKKAAKFAAEVTARFEVSIQLYLSGAYEQAQDMLQKLASGEISLINDETESEAKDEETTTA